MHRGKWFAVDIRHVLTRQSHPRNRRRPRRAATRHPREEYANERTRRVNREQAERARIQFTSVEEPLAKDVDGWGSTSRRSSPNQTYYGADPDLGCAPPLAS